MNFQAPILTEPGAGTAVTEDGCANTKTENRKTFA